MQVYKYTFDSWESAMQAIEWLVVKGCSFCYQQLSDVRLYQYQLSFTAKPVMDTVFRKACEDRKIPFMIVQ